MRFPQVIAEYDDREIMRPESIYNDLIDEIYLIVTQDVPSTGSGLKDLGTRNIIFYTGRWLIILSGIIPRGFLGVGFLLVAFHILVTQTYEGAILNYSYKVGNCRWE